MEPFQLRIRGDRLDRAADRVDRGRKALHRDLGLDEHSPRLRRVLSRARERDEVGERAAVVLSFPVHARSDGAQLVELGVEPERLLEDLDRARVFRARVGEAERPAMIGTARLEADRAPDRLDRLVLPVRARVGRGEAPIRRGLAADRDELCQGFDRAVVVARRDEKLGERGPRLGVAGVELDDRAERGQRLASPLEREVRLRENPARVRGLRLLADDELPRVRGLLQLAELAEKRRVQAVGAGRRGLDRHPLHRGKRGLRLPEIAKVRGERDDEGRVGALAHCEALEDLHDLARALDVSRVGGPDDGPRLHDVAGVEPRRGVARGDTERGVEEAHRLVDAAFLALRAGEREEDLGVLPALGEALEELRSLGRVSELLEDRRELQRLLARPRLESEGPAVCVRRERQVLALRVGARELHPGREMIRPQFRGPGVRSDGVGVVLELRVRRAELEIRARVVRACAKELLERLHRLVRHVELDVHARGAIEGLRHIGAEPRHLAVRDDGTIEVATVLVEKRELEKHVRVLRMRGARGLENRLRVVLTPEIAIRLREGERDLRRSVAAVPRGREEGKRLVLAPEPREDETELHRELRILRREEVGAFELAARTMVLALVGVEVAAETEERRLVRALLDRLRDGDDCGVEVAELPELPCELLLRDGIVRGDLDRAAVRVGGGRGLVRLRVHGSELAERAPRAGLCMARRLEDRDRLVGSALGAERGGELHARHLVVRAQLEVARERGARLDEASRRVERASEEEVRVGVVGCEPDRLLQRVDRVGRVAEREDATSNPEESRHGRRIAVEDAAVRRERFVAEPELILERGNLEEKRLPRLAERLRATEHRERVGRPLDEEIRIAEEGEAARLARRHPGRALERGNGRDGGARDVEMGLAEGKHVVRRQRPEVVRDLEMARRLREATELEEDLTEGGVELGGRDDGRLLERGRGRLELSALGEEPAVREPERRVVRVLFQALARDLDAAAVLVQTGVRLGEALSRDRAVAAFPEERAQRVARAREVAVAEVGEPEEHEHVGAVWLDRRRALEPLRGARPVVAPVATNTGLAWRERVVGRELEEPLVRSERLVVALEERGGLRLLAGCVDVLRLVDDGLVEVVERGRGVVLVPVDQPELEVCVGEVRLRRDRALERLDRLIGAATLAKDVPELEPLVRVVRPKQQLGLEKLDGGFERFVGHQRLPV